MEEFVRINYPFRRKVILHLLCIKSRIDHNLPKEKIDTLITFVASE